MQAPRTILLRPLDACLSLAGGEQLWALRLSTFPRPQGGQAPPFWAVAGGARAFPGRGRWLVVRVVGFPDLEVCGWGKRWGSPSLGLEGLIRGDGWGPPFPVGGLSWTPHVNHPPGGTSQARVAMTTGWARSRFLETLRSAPSPEALTEPLQKLGGGREEGAPTARGRRQDAPHPTASKCGGGAEHAAGSRLLTQGPCHPGAGRGRAPPPPWTRPLPR